MENAVPVAERTVSRALAARQETYTDEVRRLIEAGYTLMRRTGAIDPRVGDIVREAGLSNQAFYRHFRGKDELLLAILDDGQRRLVGYLEHRLAEAAPGPARVGEWVRAIMEQARNPDAAENTRPFAIDGARLGDHFPEEIGHSRELVLAPLRAALRDVPGTDPQRDGDAIYHLVMGSMNDALVLRTTPSDADVEHLVQFALLGVHHRT